jgi:hypothetical protein
MINDWLEFALNAVGGATAFLCLFDGTRRIGAYGMSRRALLMTSFAVIFYVFYGSFAYWKYSELTDTLSALQHKPVATQPDPGKVLSGEKREAASLAQARQAFMQSGTFETYIDRRDEKKLFPPNHEDIRKRERALAIQTQLEYAARDSLTEALLWLITGLLAVLFGFAFSRERIPIPAGPAAGGNASRSETRPAA